MVIHSIQKTSAVDKVFESLHEMIATGQYQRGQKLPSQDELAKQFGVSRNTLREAVNKLSAMGLLSSHQGVGIVVESPHPDGYLSTLSGQFLLDPLSVREFIEARICVERAAVRLAVVHADNHIVQLLQRIIADQKKALEDGDIQEFTRQDAAFHMQISQASGNRVLMKFLQTIHDMLQRFIGEVSQLPGAVENALGFHIRLTEAIADRDADRAEQEMVLHLFDVLRNIETNQKIDLQQNTMCGYNLIQQIKRARRSKRQ
jgi:GntR family transcriptional repressor for pyruvate dehydrogenase complex